MKRIIFALVSLVTLCSVPSHGREYEPTLVDGRLWVVAGYKISGYDQWHLPVYEECKHYVEVIGDTIVDGTLCKKMGKWYEGDSKKDFFVAREDCKNRKLYSSGFGSDLLCPTYDFALSKGDIVKRFIDDVQNFEEIDEQFEVTADEIIMAQSKEWRRLTLNSSFYWVEGIGSGSSLMQLTLLPTAAGRGFSQQLSLIECRQDGEVIFTREDFDAEPCGVEDVEFVKTENPKTYDIMGRSVETTVPGQLYIRAGRKFIAR